MNIKTLARLSVALWLFAILLPGCVGDLPAGQVADDGPSVDESAVVIVPAMSAEKAVNGPEFTMDLRDAGKIYQVNGSPLSQAFKMVRLVCPNGVEMTLGGWAELQSGIDIPGLTDPFATDPLLLTGAAPADAQAIMASTPMDQAAKEMACPCDVKCQVCDDGATVCTAPTCTCG